MGASKSKQKKLEKEKVEKLRAAARKTLRFSEAEVAKLQLQENIRRSVSSPSTQFQPKKRSVKVPAGLQARYEEETKEEMGSIEEMPIPDHSAPSSRHSASKRSLKGKKQLGQLSAQNKSFSDSNVVRNRGRNSTRSDPVFLDYTVVPLLLRSGMSYEAAHKLGERMKMYTQVEVDQAMSSADALLELIHSEEDIDFPMSFPHRLKTDKFWETGAIDKRKSYVYFRSDPETRKSVNVVRHKSVANPGQRPTSRRSEFRQELAPSSGVGELALTRDQLRALTEVSKRDNGTRKAVQQFYGA